MVGHETLGVFNLLWISEQLTGQPVMFLGALNPEHAPLTQIDCRSRLEPSKLNLDGFTGEKDMAIGQN